MKSEKEKSEPRSQGENDPQIAQLSHVSICKETSHFLLSQSTSSAWSHCLSYAQRIGVQLRATAPPGSAQAPDLDVGRYHALISRRCGFSAAAPCWGRVAKSQVEIDPSPQMAGMRGYTLGQSVEELWTTDLPEDASAGVFDTALRRNPVASRCATAEDASGSLGALSG